MRLSWVMLIAPALMLAGCLHWPGPMGAPKVMNLLGGQEGYELVKIPALAQVEMYRMTRQYDKADTKAIGGWKIASGPTRPEDAALKRLSEVLTSDASYDFNVAKRCAFQPDVALRFNGVKKRIDLVFCLTCSEVQVLEGEKKIGSAYFDPAAEEIRHLLK